MTLESAQRFAWDVYFMIPPRRVTLAERRRESEGVDALLGPSNGRLGLPRTALAEAATIARARMESDGPPSSAMIADAARFAEALGLTPEDDHCWRGECPVCGLRDSLMLTARLQRVEAVCDSGVCDPFTLEAAIDGRLTQLGVDDFRDWPWKAAAIASRRAAS
jgi:hypothetical protein